MTQEQSDVTVEFIQRYWFVGLLLVALTGFSYGVGEKISAMQTGLDAHEAEIRAIEVTQQQETTSLQAIQVELAQNAQQLMDIKANIGNPMQKGGD